jgi:DNA-binding cell septation regulator SpoVG
MQLKSINIRNAGFGKIIAFAEITTQDGLIIDGFKIIDGAKGLFVGFPSQKNKDGEYNDTVSCEEKEVKFEISNQIIEAYKEFASSGDKSTKKPSEKATKKETPKNTDDDLFA